jgi:hypothetical protein
MVIGFKVWASSVMKRDIDEGSFVFLSKETTVK